MFGVNQPKDFGKKAEAPTLNGKKFYEYELKLLNGDVARVIPLHGLNEGLSVRVHKMQVQVGNMWRNPVCGRLNEHLFPQFDCLFCNRELPEELHKVKTNRYMLVFVVNAPRHLSYLEGGVAYIDLKYSQYQAMEDWAKTEDEGATVAGHLVALTRTGKGKNDTSYSASVKGLQPLPVPQEKFQETINFIVGELKRTNTPNAEWHKLLFDNALKGAVPADKKDTAPGAPSHKPDEGEQEEIAF